MKRALRTALFLVLAALVIWLVRRSGVLDGDPWDPLTLRAWVGQAGPWGPALFVAVAIIKPMFVPQPIGLAWIAGGLFGTGPGGVLIAVAGLGSSVVGYLVGMLGRSLAPRDLIEGYATRFARSLSQRFQSGEPPGWRTIAFYRVVVPWDLISYWAGARRLPLAPYFGGTVIALLPVSFAYAFAANAVTTGEGNRLALAIPLLLGLLFGPLWVAERRSTRGRAA